MLLLTDGIEESISPDNTLFGTERMLQVVQAAVDKSAREIVEGLYEAVRQFSQNAPQTDDVTAIMIKVRT